MEYEERMVCVDEQYTEYLSGYIRRILHFRREMIWNEKKYKI